MFMSNEKTNPNCLTIKMRNCCIILSCIRAVKAKKRKRVLLVVKTDGKVLEFKPPLLVKDILVNFSSSGIGLSREDDSVHHLPIDYELKIGTLYYILPSIPLQEARGSSGGDSVKRIKVVITKQQLKRLLTKQISLEDVMLEDKKNISCLVDFPRDRWKPKLESIPE